MEITSLGSFIAALKEKQLHYLGLTPTESDTRSLTAKLFDFWYRGERDKSWNLQPKVFRKKYDERDLTNRFRLLSKSRHFDVPEYDNYGLFLSLMQHYRLPTRLLDWSTSPLIALYVAIEKYVYEPDRTPVDASVWILYPYKLNQMQIGANNPVD
jgi:hypothetical protein